MGLLESVLGAALGGGQQQNNQGGLGGMRRACWAVVAITRRAQAV